MWSASSPSRPVRGQRDPLIFYRALAGHAREKLLPGGGIFVEIHEELAAGVIAVFRKPASPGSS